MALISIIIPCYNEAEVLPLFYTEITKTAEYLSGKYGLDFEFVFVNDGSRDTTLETLKALHERDEAGRVHYISFSRNFGKEAAMYAGLENSSGNYVVVMDADLQDPPGMIEAMYLGVLEEGYDCVGSRRVTRKGEPQIRSFFARMFYRVINKISQTPIVDGARDFRLMTRQMVDAILSLSEKNRFSKGLFSWVGFNTKWLEYENCERAAGETSWSFWGLFLYSIDGIVAFSTAPLVIATVVGIIMCIAAFILVIFYAVKTILYGDPVDGFPTLICVILFLGGMQLLCMGILSQYMAKTYIEVKNRPIYIVKEKK